MKKPVEMFETPSFKALKAHLIKKEDYTGIMLLVNAIAEESQRVFNMIESFIPPKKIGQRKD